MNNIDEQAFFAVFRNKDLLRYICEFHYTSLYDAIRFKRFDIIKKKGKELTLSNPELLKDWKAVVATTLEICNLVNARFPASALTLAQLVELLSISGENGKLEIFQWFFQKLPDTMWNPAWNSTEHLHKILTRVIAAKQYAIMNWLASVRPLINRYAGPRAAAAQGNVEDLKSFLKTKHSLCQHGVSLFHVASTEGRLDFVKWLVQTVHIPKLYELNALRGFAAKQSIEGVKWALQQYPSVDNIVIAIQASSKGHHEVAQLLLNSLRVGSMNDAIDFAAKNGHLKVLKILHENNWPCSTRAMDFAAANGHLEIVEWLHKHRTEGCTQLAMTLAAKNGHLSIVEWLHQHRTEGCDSSTINLVGCSGHEEVVKFLASHLHQKLSTNTQRIIEKRTKNPRSKKQIRKFNNTPTDAPLKQRVIPPEEISFFKVFTSIAFLRQITRFHCSKLYIALRRNRTDSLEFCGISKTSSGNQKEWSSALANKNTTACKWLFDHNLLPRHPESISQGVVLTGNLDFISWLHSVNLFKPTQGAILEAARRGFLDILQLIQKNKIDENFLQSTQAMDAAVSAGHINVVKWLQELGGRIPRPLLTAAARSGSVEVLQHVYSDQAPNTRDGCYWPGCVGHALANGHLEVCKWLLKVAPSYFNFDALVAAAESGQLEMLQWLISEKVQMYPGIFVVPIAAAAGRGHEAVVKFLLEKMVDNGIGVRDKQVSELLAIGHTGATEWLCKWKCIKEEHLKNELKNGRENNIEILLKNGIRPTDPSLELQLANDRGFHGIAKLLAHYCIPKQE